MEQQFAVTPKIILRALEGIGAPRDWCVQPTDLFVRERVITRILNKRPDPFLPAFRNSSRNYETGSRISRPLGFPRCQRSLPRIARERNFAELCLLPELVDRPIRDFPVTAGLTDSGAAPPSRLESICNIHMYMLGNKAKQRATTEQACDQGIIRRGRCTAGTRGRPARDRATAMRRTSRRGSPGKVGNWHYRETSNIPSGARSTVKHRSRPFSTVLDCRAA